MTTLLIIAIYLVGCILGYLSMRKIFKIMFEEWTIGNRIFVLSISLSSWVAVFVAFVVYVICVLENYNKPAKW